MSSLSSSFSVVSPVVSSPGAVDDPPEAQPLRRGHFTFERPAACAAERGSNILALRRSPADPDEGRGDGPRHLSQEGVCGDVDRHRGPGPPDTDPVDRPNAVATDRSSESPEVVAAHEDRRGSGHGCLVELLADPQSGPLPERAALTVPDRVAVLAPDGPPRLETSHGCTEVTDRDVPGEQGVESALEVSARKAAPVVEGDHLTECVDAGVGPTRRRDAHTPPTGHVGERRLQLSLDRPGPRLLLEPGEGRAVVFDPRAVPHGAALSGELATPQLT